MNKITYWILAILLWGIWWHKFYIGKSWLWFLYIILNLITTVSFWLPIISFISIIEWIIALTETEEVFNKKNFKK